MHRVQLSCFDEVERALDALAAGPKPSPTGRAFLLGQALAHCALSVRCSLEGYPKLRSALFRATLGRIGLRKFLRQGFMEHDRAAPIPGAPCIASDVTFEGGADALREGIAAFRGHSGPLAPHLAFGALPKDVYERIHSMHVADHLSAFQGAWPTR